MFFPQYYPMSKITQFALSVLQYCLYFIFVIIFVYIQGLNTIPAWNRETICRGSPGILELVFLHPGFTKSVNHCRFRQIFISYLKHTVWRSYAGYKMFPSLHCEQDVCASDINPHLTSSKTTTSGGEEQKESDRDRVCLEQNNQMGWRGDMKHNGGLLRSQCCL